MIEHIYGNQAMGYRIEEEEVSDDGVIEAHSCGHLPVRIKPSPHRLG